MKRGHKVGWISIFVLLILGAGAATAAALAGSSAPQRAFGTPAPSVVAPAGTVQTSSLPRLHRGPISVPHTQAPAPALLAARAGVAISAQRGPLQGIRPTALRKAAGPPAPGASPASRQRKGPDGPLSAVFPGAAFETLNSFTGATLNSTGCCEPPDTQLAVSSNRELEEVNLTGFVYDRGGNQLGSFDLTSLMALGAANSNGSDPKVMYDAGSDRWFATLMVCQNGGCGGSGWTTMGVDLAVSQTNDPLGGWTVYQNVYSGTPFNDQGNLQDQPKLGFSDDKVTVSDNVYTGHCGAGSCFKSEDVIVFQKSDLLSAVGAHYAGFTSPYAFDSIPAIPTPVLGGNATQFVAWQGFGSIGVNQITGTPLGGGVNNSNQQSPGIGGMTGTVIPTGMPDVSGNYIESVAWSNNRLWAVSTDGCGSPVVDCTRVDEVDTSNAGALSVALDQNIGDAGAYETFPSVTVSCLGDLVFGITYSNNSGNLPSAQAVGTSTPGSGYIRAVAGTGDTTYSGGRWGDYSSTVQDPADCGNVWTAQEFGALGSSGNWATGIGQFSFDSPSGSSSQTSGPATGGTAVDIFGADLVNGGTSVSFGGTPAAVSFIDSGHIQAFSPAGAGGPASITLATANGTITVGSFTWIPVVTGVTPSQGPEAGGTTINITGAGFTGATEVDFNGAPATSYTVNNNSDITAVTPAGTGAVAVQVITAGNVSPATPSDVFTYVDENPTAAYTPSTYTPAVGQTVTFNGAASADPDGSIASYVWVWGDGTPNGSGATASHAFTTQGTRSVGLYVTDSAGRTAAVGHGITVTASDESPTAAYTPSSYTPRIGQTVSFNGSASNDPDGTITTYRWVWGDGTPDGSGATPTHVFTTQGLRSVGLYVTDSGGRAAAVGHGITVGDELPTAAYTPSSYTPRVGQTVSFNGSASSDPDGTISTYRWVWGDGTPDGSGVAPTHVFTTQGVHSVGLYVTDSGGQTAAVGHGITVGDELPTATYTPSTYAPHVGQTVTFNATASSDPDGTISSYSWVWGDGTPNGSGATATHAFATQGVRHPLLTVTDSSGLTAQAAHTITVGP